MVGPDDHGPRPIPSVQGRRRESVRRRAGCRCEGPDVPRRSPEGLSLRGPAARPGPLRRGLLQEPPWIRGTAGTRAAIEALANPDTLLIEMAHDGQLPHLGIVR